MVTQTGQGVYLAIRGVTTTDQTSKGEPGILFSVDGIPVGRAEEQALAFFDLQRVEVLSGPQGTLYGKSSTGGAVNVITNAPTWDQSAYADLTVGNYDTKRLDGVIDLPLSDSVAVRLSAASNARKGYVTLLGGGGENNGGDRPGDENDAEPPPPRRPVCLGMDALVKIDSFGVPTRALRRTLPSSPSMLARLKPDMSVLPGGVPIIAASGQFLIMPLWQ